MSSVTTAGMRTSLHSRLWWELHFLCFLDELRFEKKKKGGGGPEGAVLESEASGCRRVSAPGAPRPTLHCSVKVATAAAWGCGAAGPERAAVTVTARFWPGVGSCVLGPQPRSVAKPSQ